MLVATFDPHPVRFFKPDLPPFRLTTLDQRERLFGAAGADAMLVFHFDAELAAVDRRPISSPTIWSAGSAPPASSPARISPSARAAAAMSRC